MGTIPTDDKELKIYVSPPNNPKFKKPEDIQYKYDIIRKILGRKTICLRCHTLHVINSHNVLIAVQRLLNMIQKSIKT